MADLFPFLAESWHAEKLCKKDNRIFRSKLLTHLVGSKVHPSPPQELEQRGRCSPSSSCDK